MFSAKFDHKPINFDSQLIKKINFTLKWLKLKFWIALILSFLYLSSNTMSHVNRTCVFFHDGLFHHITTKNDNFYCKFLMKTTDLEWSSHWIVDKYDHQPASVFS